MTTPEPWEQAKQIRNRCPGLSHKQARKALTLCHGDVEKAIAHLKSQGEASQASPQDPKSETRQDEDVLHCLQLPTLLEPAPLREPGEQWSFFSLFDVISTAQSGDSMDTVYQYLAFHHENNREELEDNINGEVEGFPAIFYVVETHDIGLIRRWVKYGGNPKAIHAKSGVPLIAFVILRNHRPRIQSVELVKLLLLLGASPLVVPAAFYDPFNYKLLSCRVA
ncbi:hypothetical protein F5Y08DRAFT_347079 [Xylaria arbuscula]|nr:hypothetical protein F5Y08DRAFT_347079 [Xylaria arbuscula]